MVNNKKKQLKGLGSDADVSKTTLPKDDMFLGIVEKRLGGGRMRVRSVENEEFLARVPGRVKKFLWVRENDVVLLKPWEFDKKKVDLIYKYKPIEVKHLHKKGFNVNFEEYEEF